jgi:DNA polymerase-3 subunit beta
LRVSVTQQSLAKALSITSRAVSSRTTRPVLSNILLEAKAGQLRLAATNREIGINCWIAANVEDEGAITIPARLLSELVNSLPAERIDLDLDVRTQTLHLSCARSEANVRGIAADDFPLLPTLDALTARPEDATPDWAPGVLASFGASQLRKMIDQVTFAASTDENRPTLTGVEVTLQPEMVQMAATDGYRLSVRTLAIEGGPAKTIVIVPAKSLGEVARISADADESQPVQCLITPQRNQVLFAMVGSEKAGIQRVELVSELIDARFPDYRATIPKTYTTRTVVDTAALLKAVRVALLFARDNANIIRLHIADDQLRLTGTSVEMGDNVGDLAAEVEGAAMEIAFNGKYLIDVLSQIGEPQVALETTHPTRPGAWMPVGNDNFLHVNMPMMPPKG